MDTILPIEQKTNFAELSKQVRMASPQKSIVPPTITSPTVSNSGSSETWFPITLVLPTKADPNAPAKATPEEEEAKRMRMIKIGFILLLVLIISIFLMGSLKPKKTA